MGTWICFTTNNGYEYIRKSAFTEQRVCDAGNGYGGTIGCHDAGCYSADNSASRFLEDLIEELEIDMEKLTEHMEEVFEDVAISELYAHGLEPLFEAFPEREEEIKTWVEENEDHCEEYIYEYWDGSNYRYLSLDTIENSGNYAELELEIVDKEVPNEGVIDHRLHVKESDGEEYYLTITRYAGAVTYSKEELENA